MYDANAKHAVIAKGTSEVTMKMHGILAMFALAAIPAATLNAQAPPQATPARYAFTCDSASALSLTPVSFNFSVSQNLNIGSQSSGAGAGKVTFSTLTVKFRTSGSYAQIWQDVERGAHYSACTLTETTRSLGKGGAAGATYTWDFHLVAPASVTLIGSDASNTDSGGTNVPTGYVQATFEYGAVSASVSQ